MNKHASIAILTACLPVVFLVVAESAAAQDTEIRFLCSNGIRGAVEKLLPEYERSMGRSIKVQYGTSAGLKRSIEGGEPFDLAVLSQPVIADLIKEGKIAAGTGVDLASSGIGIAVRAGDRSRTSLRQMRSSKRCCDRNQSGTLRKARALPP